jgi:hypothetical protein
MEDATLAANKSDIHAWRPRRIFDSATILSVRCRTPFLVAFTLANCSSPGQIAENEWTPAPSPDLGVVVARVGQVPIFAKQIEAQAKKASIPLRAALEDLVASSLLAEATRQRGHAIASASDPDVQSALVQRLLEKELEPKIRLESIPDSDLRPWYERVRDTFVHPRLVEIGVLAVYTGAPMPKESREPREQTARELAQFLKGHPAKTLDEFSALARDTSWEGRHVVFKHMFQGTDKPLSEAVGAEVSKLRAPGDTTPLVVDIDGAFIARYIGERPPENITFEQARGKLAAGVYEHWRRQQFLEYTTKLARLHRVETHFDRLPSDEQGL